jgi:hypothetical protein
MRKEADEHLHGARRWAVLAKYSSRNKGVGSAAGGRVTGVARRRGSQAAPDDPCWLLAAVIRQRHRSTCLENSKLEHRTRLGRTQCDLQVRLSLLLVRAVSKQVFEKHWAGDASSPWSRSSCTVRCPDQPHGPMPGRRCHRITVSNSHSHFLACRHHNYAAPASCALVFPKCILRWNVDVMLYNHGSNPERPNMMA